MFKFNMGIGRATRRWKECDESLKAFAHMAVASLVGCSFCLDLGYFSAHHEGLDLAEQQAAVESFRAAIEDGDLQGLLDSLAPDVVLVIDGGGLAPALPRPVRGVERVARVLAELLGRLAGTTPHARVGPVWLNGAPALWVEIDGKVDTAISLSLGEGRITGIYGIRNPHKLTRLTDAVSVSRTS